MFQSLSNPKISPDSLELDASEGRRIRMTRPLSGAWRIQVSDSEGTFTDRGACQMLAEELGEKPPEIRHPVMVSTPASGRLLLDSCGSGALTIDLDPLRIDFARGTVLRTGCGVEEPAAVGSLQDEERLWGTGERFDSLDQRGRRVSIWAEDKWCQTEGNTYMPIPFLLSSLGYGLLVNSFEGMTLDLGSRGAAWSVEGLSSPLDLYIFDGASPREIIKTLTELTGRPPMPPDWAFGMLVSRHERLKEFTTREGISAMIARMDELDLPWSGAIIEGWPTYDRSSYAELKRVADDLHARGKTVMVYDTCGRVSQKHWDSLGARDEFCVRNVDGSLDLDEASHHNKSDAPNRRRSRFLDITSPEAVRWWLEEVWGPLMNDVGVDGAKIDFCEQFPEHEPLSIADGRPLSGMHHYYPTKYNAIMHRLFQSSPRGGLCWSRGGGIGAARYPFLWCGDQLREYRYLKTMLLAALSSGLSGVPFMGHDMSGYMPAREPDKNPEPEVFVRGAQMAAFFPMMSTHGTVTRPYDFEKQIVDLYRIWTKVHYALVPYIKEQALESCRTGVPFLRPMCMAFHNDEVASCIEDQFMMGECLLVMPVLERGDCRRGYLPAGAWRSLYDMSEIVGPVELEKIDAPLSRIPVYVSTDARSHALPCCLEAVRGLLSDV